MTGTGPTGGRGNGARGVEAEGRQEVAHASREEEEGRDKGNPHHRGEECILDGRWPPFVPEQAGKPTDWPWQAGPWPRPSTCFHQDLSSLDDAVVGPSGKTLARSPIRATE